VRRGICHLSDIRRKEGEGKKKKSAPLPAFIAEKGGRHSGEMGNTKGKLTRFPVETRKGGREGEKIEILSDCLGKDWELVNFSGGGKREKGKRGVPSR